MRKNLWINRVGEVKEVGGYVFTLIGLYTSDKVTVDVNGIEYIVSRTVWNNGVFRDIMKKLNPCEKKSKTVASRVSKYINQEKNIGDYMCRVIEYNKNKVLVEVEGYEGNDWMSVSTWIRASVKGFIKRIKEKFVKIITKTKYELVLWQPVVRDGFGRFSEATCNIITSEFEKCSSIQDARAVLRKYANYCHPDKGFNSYIDRQEWSFVIHTYEATVLWLDILQNMWDDDDNFSWE